MMVEIMEQVIFIQAILHVRWKLQENKLLAFIVDCIIIILAPFVGKEIFKFGVKMFWVAKAIIKLFHDTEEPVEVI